MHSHNYRGHEPFQDQVVVIVGSSISAVDISRDIATVAKGIHIASRSSANQAYGKQPGYDNLWLHPMVAPLPMFKYQSKWIAGCLSSRIGLPSQEEKMDDVKAFSASPETSGIPKHYTHNMVITSFSTTIGLRRSVVVLSVKMYDAASKSRRARRGDIS